MPGRLRRRSVRPGRGCKRLHLYRRIGQQQMGQQAAGLGFGLGLGSRLVLERVRARFAADQHQLVAALHQRTCPRLGVVLEQPVRRGLESFRQFQLAPAQTLPVQ